MPLVRERLKSIPESAETLDYFLKEEIPTPAKELLIPRKMDQVQTLQALEGALEALREVGSEFKEADLETALRGAAQKLGFEDGQVFMPIRVAVSGRTATPGIFETLRVLGKERVLKRVEKAVEALKV